MSWLNLSSVSSVICTFQVFSITKRLSFAVDVRPFCGPHFQLGPTDDNPGGTFRQREHWSTFWAPRSVNGWSSNSDFVPAKAAPLCRTRSKRLRCQSTAVCLANGSSTRVAGKIRWQLNVEPFNGLFIGLPAWKWTPEDTFVRLLDLQYWPPSHRRILRFKYGLKCQATG